MPHILQPHQGSVGVRFQNDVVELRRLTEPPHCPNAHLVLLSRNRRLLPHLPRRDFHVLLRQRIHHVGRREPASRHPHRIQPQPHRELALAKDDHVRHARNALQRIPHVHVEIVAHEQRGEFLLIRENGRAKHEVLRGLCRRDANGLDRARQPSLRRVHAVLNVHRGQVRIAVQIKRHQHLACPIVPAGRGDVLHPLRAVDLLFDGDRDRALHRLRAGPDVDAGDAHLWRRQRRKLRDRQRRYDRGARQNNQQRAHRSEHRTLDKEVNEHEESRVQLSLLNDKSQLC